MSEGKQPPKLDDDAESVYKSKFEERFDRALNPFQAFAQSQITASILLVGAAILAIFFANNEFLQPYYDSILNQKFFLQFGTLSIGGNLTYWVNDILLSLFFFLVGLEIKREFIAGELAEPTNSLLVLLAAIGGMVVPAAIFAIFNYDTPTQHGWGIPVATDTAFSLGVLALFRKKLPSGIFTFLAALAIIDDIGAIVLIAAFYSNELNPEYLAYSAIVFLLMLLGNCAGIRKTLFYIMLGIILWAFLEHAGLHSVFAGVLIAFCIPARPEHGPNWFLQNTSKLLDYVKNRKQRSPRIIEDKRQHYAIQKIQKAAIAATTPLQRLETNLELPISLIILPVFAFFNAGLLINMESMTQSLSSNLAWGIILGLFIGKPLGIALFSAVAIYLRIGSLPKKTKFRHIISASLLAGIGFTMSLFINNLAFEGNSQFISIAKAGVLIGSLCSFLLGTLFLFLLQSNKKKRSLEITSEEE